MILYRGTKRPEPRPRSKEYPCIFMSWKFRHAEDYALNESSTGYVQEYNVGPQDLLDIMSKHAQELARIYLGRKVVRHDDLVDLFWFPELDWVGLVSSFGYTGLSEDRNICIFDASRAKLLRRWKVP